MLLLSVTIIFLSVVFSVPANDDIQPVFKRDTDLRVFLSVSVEIGGIQKKRAPELLDTECLLAQAVLADEVSKIMEKGIGVATEDKVGAN